MGDLRIGPAETFVLVRETLHAAGYVEAAICERLEISYIGRARSLIRQVSAFGLRDGLDVCIRLFLDGAFVDVETMRAMLPGAGVAAMEELELVRRYPHHPEQCAATVMLCPTRGIYVVSDRESNADLSPFELPLDTVYPAIGKGTQRFLHLLPDARPEAFLEMCGGAGAAALIAAAGGAKHAFTYDITARSTHFADFNRRLNGLENVTAKCGDLYAPAGDLTFDFIAAHPPYVPSSGEGLIYKEGGEDGEFITRSIIKELPRYLRPGGEFHCLCAGGDRADGPFEERIRSWLGEAEGEFDIVLVSEGIFNPQKFKGWDLLSERFQIRSIFYGSVVIRRHSSVRRPFTLRRIREEGADYASTAWLFQCAEALTLLSSTEVLNLQPRINRELEFQVLHRWSEGEFRVTGLELRIRRPFPRHVQGEPWVIRFLEACDGRHTCAEIVQRLRASGEINDAPADVISGMVCTMLLEGFLTVNSLPAIV